MSSLEPLRVRAGAIFTCHGDGLCCTDVHSLGPLRDDEVLTLRAIDERVVVSHQGDAVIRSGPGGRCVFRTEGRCELHAGLGVRVKPESCRQFPFLLVATPTGGRVATEHRCPCRTMGERAPVVPSMALEVCSSERPDRTVTASLPLDTDEAIDVPTWEAMERGLFDAIASGQGLGADPFSGGDWEAYASSLEDEVGESRFASSLRCFSAAILESPLRAPPWADVFDRAERRSEEGLPEAMLADWLADAVWSLEWAFAATWRQARIDLSTRAHLARRIATGLGGRPDRAMAEAIAIVELVGLSTDHQAFVATLG